MLGIALCLNFSSTRSNPSQHYKAAGRHVRLGGFYFILLPMNYWLVKTDPESYSINDFAKDKKTSWNGVRNYQARNFMKAMKKGDGILFYHSQENPGSVTGIAKVAKEAYPDDTAQDKKNAHYYDPKATPENPIWYMVDIALVKKLKHPVTLTEIKKDPFFAGMPLRAQGSRLSVQPVEEKHFKKIERLGLDV